MPQVTKESWTEGDEVTLTGTAQDLDGTVEAIGGATIELIYWLDGKRPAKLTGSIVSGAAGTFQALFTAGLLPGPGLLRWKWRLTDSSGKVFHSTRTWSQQIERKANV